MRVAEIVLWATLAGVVAACAPMGGPTSTPTPTGRPAVTEPMGSMTPAEARVLEMAKQELAQRTGADPSEIVVQRIEPVDWRDSSLGCPAPGKAYAQVITPGFRVVLEIQGRSYELHSDQGTRVVLCQPQ